MKAFPLIAFLGVSLILAGCAATDPAGRRVAGGITSEGIGEVKITPDEIVLYLGVVKKNQDVEKARAECDGITNGILDLAVKCGIGRDAVKTDFLKIKPEYVQKDGETVFDGYVLTKNIVVTVRDVDKFDDVFTKAVALGVTHIHDVQFNATKLADLQDQAKDKALADARRKAEWQARQLGRKVGDVIAITEESSRVSNWYIRRQQWDNLSYKEIQTENIPIDVVTQQGDKEGKATEAAVRAVDEPRFNFGQITVSARMRVTFALVEERKPAPSAP